MAKIKHIAIFTDDPDKLADFYCRVFGMTITQKTVTPRGGRSAWVTDGYVDVALISPEDRAARRGINHFGFTLDEGERDDILQRLKDEGIEPYKPPVDRPYIEDAVLDPDGNKFDMTSRGLLKDHPNRDRYERERLEKTEKA
jgi:lactoylglutathione lyase